MAFTFYAITRHRLFDVRFVVSRMTVMLLLTAMLVALQVLVYRSLSAVIWVLPGIVITSLIAGTALFVAHDHPAGGASGWKHCSPSGRSTIGAP